MELTRRDALKALVVGGGATGTSLAVSETVSQDKPASETGEYTDSDIETLSLVAEVVYPSTVEVTSAFLETYVDRLDGERQAALSRTIRRLDRVTESRYGTSVSDCENVARCETMLRSLGVHRVQSAPDGTMSAQVRYHLVNTLLYALFTSPAGSELVGIRSPVGHPGGFAVYQEHDE